MRFSEEGPDIPDELLEARDRGEVVFICGAGISMPAGLPSFLTLAQQVISELGVSKGDGAHVLLDQIVEAKDEYQPPIDQVFGRLRKNYGSLVDEAVFRKLRIKRSARLEKHKMLLHLSADANGTPRLVTTNFDPLFELAQKGLKKYVAPELPDLNAIQSFSGIVYLHGRMPQKSTEATGTPYIVLSSSDFGRAYLSQGWAARFVRDLLQRFTVVLLGYSASDPSIRYLLEGLETSAFDSRHKIYAFEAGTQNEIVARWRDRNVRGISYTKVDKDHSGLWNTIDLWAKRAKSPSDWRNETIDLALRGPVNVNATERGQVVSLVSSVDGAKAFADAQPSPSPEWLCVFDRNQRYAKPSKIHFTNTVEKEIDPQEYYGLDNDPPRLEESSAGNRKSQTGADPLASTDGEHTLNSYRRLSNLSARGTSQLPPRLFHLARWIGKHVNDPITAWWAGRQLSLHPEITNQIDFNLNKTGLLISPVLRTAWDAVLEAFANGDHDELQYRWYDIDQKVKNSGWTSSLLRELEAFLLPKLKIDHSIFSPTCPSGKVLEELSVDNIVKLKVTFPDFFDGLNKIDDLLLPTVVRMARRGLERGSQLLEEFERFERETPTLFPQNTEGTTYHDERAKYFLWFGGLFRRLCEVALTTAADEFRQWPDDTYHFNKLRLFALTFTNVFSAKATFEHLVQLDSESFWHSGSHRELLLLMKGRWNSFTKLQQATLCKKICHGPPKWEGEESKKHEERTAYSVLGFILWMDKNDCKLPASTFAKIGKLRSIIPEWRDSWADSQADSRESRTGWVKEDTDATSLKALPLSQVLENATRETTREIGNFVEHRPFKGLVAENPFAALAALSLGARKGQYPAGLWRELLTAWPKDPPIRLDWLLALRLARVPPDLANELRYYLPSWLETHLPRLAQAEFGKALEIWNAALDALVRNGPDATKGSMGDTFSAGKKVQRSRRTYYYSGGPIGSMADTLFSILNDLKLGKGKKIPPVIKDGLAKIWSAPGEGADQALSSTGRRLLWLEYIDPKWVKEHLLPNFDLASPRAEPTWSGYLHSQQLPHEKLFQQIKIPFVGLVDKMRQWDWGDDEQSEYCFLVVLACWWNQKNDKYLNWNTTRTILKLLDDGPRARAVHTASQISFGQSAWKTFGKAFFERAWPKETMLQSKNSSYALINFAEMSDGLFPEVVKVISKYVYPLDHPDLFIFKMKKEDNGKGEGPALASRFPLSVLELLERLVPHDQNYPPYELSTLLNLIADAKPEIRQDKRWLRLRRLANVG